MVRSKKTDRIKKDLISVTILKFVQSVSILNPKSSVIWFDFWCLAILNWLTNKLKLFIYL